MTRISLHGLSPWFYDWKSSRIRRGFFFATIPMYLSVWLSGLLVDFVHSSVKEFHHLKQLLKYKRNEHRQFLSNCVDMQSICKYLAERSKTEFVANFETLNASFYVLNSSDILTLVTVLKVLTKELTALYPPGHQFTTYIQESPPAWTQEAYRPPCSKYFLCCAILADPPPRLDLTPPPAGPDPPPPSWTWPTPPPPAGPDPPLPLQLDLTPPAGPDPPLPPSWTWPTPPPPAGPDPPGWTWPTPPPPRCGLTNKVKLLPSRRTTYAGGNKSCKYNDPITVTFNRVRHNVKQFASRFINVNTVKHV